MSSSDSAVLDWHDGQPRSRRFGDIYFSRSGGLDEARHVFIDGNDLPSRWRALAPDARFTVGELGFGTGLNFLCAWQAFLRHAPPGAQLHYVSCELEPLGSAELRAALALWPDLSAVAQPLLAQYRAPAPGWHRFAFPGHSVHLTLLVGDARECLPRLAARVDAWFFDGFSPDRNPQLWEPGLFRAAAACSAPDATLSTYSVAGAVRRAAADAGFEVWKAPGFGSKRDMLRARLRADVPMRRSSSWRSAALAPSHDDASGAAHADHAAHLGERQAVPRARSATVIGAGLAGCCVAYSLARRGWRVRLVERHQRIATEASGNAQGILYARLGAGAAPLHRFVLAGYQYSLRLLRQLLPCDGVQWSDAPVLQLARDAADARRHAAIADLGLPASLVRGVDASEAAAIAGIELGAGGLVFEGGGWVHPPAFCAALAASAGIELALGRTVRDVRTGADGRIALDFDAPSGAAVDGARRIGRGDPHRDDRDQIDEAPGIVVIATAGAALDFSATAHLPLRFNRGQVTQLPATPASAAMRAVVCAERYLAPAREGWHTTGATFSREARADARAQDDAENLAMVETLSPLLHAQWCASDSIASATGRAGVRCVSPDYLPLVGALCDARGRTLPNLFVSLAHGSRGLISAPLAAEALAAYLEDEPAPLPVDSMVALAPQRLFRTAPLAS